MQRELSDDEWCKSFEYRPGTREYAAQTRFRFTPSGR
jgi:hypothetical protein